MDKIIQLIDSLIAIIQKQLGEPSCFEVLVTYWVPVIQLVIILFTGFAAVYKYYKTKNKDYYERMLSELYAPLFGFFIRQELYCHLHDFNREISQSPILELKTRKETNKFFLDPNKKNETTIEENTVLGISYENFIETLKNANRGLMDTKLLALVNMYETALSFWKDDHEKAEIRAKAGILKVNLENELRKEIINGFYRYQTKLKLPYNKNIESFLKIEDSNIEFTYKIDEKTLKELIKEFKEDK